MIRQILQAVQKQILKYTIILIAVLAILTSLAHSQTAEQKRHPKFPELMEHYNAYTEAYKKGDYNTALTEAKKAFKIGIKIFGDKNSATAKYYAHNEP